MNEPNKQPPPGTEPSMEEILASIRRIISEDGSTPPAAAPAKPPPPPQPAPQPTAAPQPPPAPKVEPPPETVLELTQMVSPPVNDPQPDDDPGGIASDGTIAASAAVLSGLQPPAPRPVKTLAIGDGELTLEDMVRGELRLLLREWLDENLPGLVERLVQREIQRITRSVDPS